MPKSINWKLPEGATPINYVCAVARAAKRHVALLCYNEFSGKHYAVLVEENHTGRFLYHEIHGENHMMTESSEEELLSVAKSENRNRSIVSVAL